MNYRFALVLLLVAFSVTTLAGCGLFKNGGDSPAASGGVSPVRNAKVTNVVPESVMVSRAPEGVKVAWKTKTPVAGGYALGATLCFEERPLYSLFAKETAVATPTLDHEATFAGIPAGAKFKVGIAYGENELTDNDGFGFAPAE